MTDATETILCRACFDNFHADFTDQFADYRCPTCGAVGEIIEDAFPDGDGGSVMGLVLEPDERRA